MGRGLHCCSPRIKGLLNCLSDSQCLIKGSSEIRSRFVINRLFQPDCNYMLHTRLHKSLSDLAGMTGTHKYHLNSTGTSGLKQLSQQIGFNEMGSTSSILKGQNSGKAMPAEMKRLAA